MYQQKKRITQLSSCTGSVKIGFRYILYNLTTLRKQRIWARANLGVVENTLQDSLQFFLLSSL